MYKQLVINSFDLFITRPIVVMVWDSKMLLKNTQEKQEIQLTKYKDRKLTDRDSANVLGQCGRALVAPEQQTKITKYFELLILRLTAQPRP